MRLWVRVPLGTGASYFFSAIFDFGAVYLFSSRELQLQELFSLCSYRMGNNYAVFSLLMIFLCTFAVSGIFHFKRYSYRKKSGNVSAILEYLAYYENMGRVIK